MTTRLAKAVSILCVALLWWTPGARADTEPYSSEDYDTSQVVVVLHPEAGAVDGDALASVYSQFFAKLDEAHWDVRLTHDFWRADEDLNGQSNPDYSPVAPDLIATEVRDPAEGVVFSTVEDPFIPVFVFRIEDMDLKGFEDLVFAELVRFQDELATRIIDIERRARTVELRIGGRTGASPPSGSVAPGLPSPMGLPTLSPAQEARLRQQLEWLRGEAARLREAGDMLRRADREAYYAVRYRMAAHDPVHQPYEGELPLGARAVSAHLAGATGEGVHVALIDTGVLSSHDDLQLPRTQVWDCTNADSNTCVQYNGASLPVDPPPANQGMGGRLNVTAVGTSVPLARWTATCTKASPTVPVGNEEWTLIASRGGMFFTYTGIQTDVPWTLGTGSSTLALTITAPTHRVMRNLRELGTPANQAWLRLENVILSPASTVTGCRIQKLTGGWQVTVLDNANVPSIQTTPFALNAPYATDAGEMSFTLQHYGGEVQDGDGFQFSIENAVYQVDDNFAFTTRMGNDDNGHGTHMAGIINARVDGRGIMGIAPNATLHSIKAFNVKGRATTEDVIKAVRQVHEITRSNCGTPDPTWGYQRCDDKVRVGNLSWGSSQPDSGLHLALRDLQAEGVIWVAAAGNGAEHALNNYPGAWHDTVLTAAGTMFDEAGGRPRLVDWLPDTNYGDWGPLREIKDELGNVVRVVDPKVIATAAPASQAESTWNDRLYASLSGTSVAAAHTSGVVALLLEQHKPSAGRELSLAQVKRRLHEHGRPLVRVRDTTTLNKGTGWAEVFRADPPTVFASTAPEEWYLHYVGGPSKHWFVLYGLAVTPSGAPQTGHVYDDPNLPVGFVIHEGDVAFDPGAPALAPGDDFRFVRNEFRHPYLRNTTLLDAQNLFDECAECDPGDASCACTRDGAGGFTPPCLKVWLHADKRQVAGGGVEVRFKGGYCGRPGQYRVQWDFDTRQPAPPGGSRFEVQEVDPQNLWVRHTYFGADTYPVEFRVVDEHAPGWNASATLNVTIP